MECIPRVRYFRKLFRGHVYPLVVQLGAKGGESVGPLPAGAQVEVQPFLPGAMVWPQKRTLQGDKREARFWVMPLAKGKLREGYVSISSGTGKAQELRVPMRVKEGRGWLFWLCLWLTLLLPVGVFILRALPVDTVVFEYTAIRPSPSTGEETAMPFKGRKAVEAWLEDLEAEAKAIPAQERSIRHWLMLLLGKGKPYLAEAYDGYEIMLQENMLAEPIVFVVMLLITLIVGWWTGAKRRTVVGEVMKVTGP
ncbi:MAG: hypothetical protein RMI91_08955 [Gemmatales bacterium]|nr:hypothetical protein [Gemmatales bacterium]MDW7994767.1 hypothetical protein [Gemmatales bacterium]